MLMRVIFGAVVVIVGLLAYQQFSHKATVDNLYETSPDFILGQQNAQYTIIEFFDYNSKWSRRSHPVLLQMISRYPDTRIILKEKPGITSDSEMISRIALAARTKGRYMEMHTALMSMEGEIDETRLRSIVAQMGMDFEELKQIGQGPEVSRILQENEQAAFFLGIQSAPSFVVEGEVMSGGGYTVDDFRAVIRQIERGVR